MVRRLGAVFRLLLAISVVCAVKDDSYYPAGIKNPNVQHAMYWNDAANVLQDLEQFSELYVQYHSCAWSPLVYEASTEDGVEETDQWYMDAMPPFGATVVFSLYGVLDGEKETGCNKKTYINSFYTTSDFSVFASAIKSAGITNTGTQFTASCEDRAQIICDETTRPSTFALANYNDDSCDPDSYSSSSVPTDLVSFNKVLKNDAQCAKIYSSGASAPELLESSRACALGDYVGACPDPYGMKSLYEHQFAKFASSSELDEWEYRLGYIMLTTGFLLMVTAIILVCSGKNTYPTKITFSTNGKEIGSFELPRIAMGETGQAIRSLTRQSRSAGYEGESYKQMEEELDNFRRKTRSEFKNAWCVLSPQVQSGVPLQDACSEVASTLNDDNQVDKGDGNIYGVGWIKTCDPTASIDDILFTDDNSEGSGKSVATEPVAEAILVRDIADKTSKFLTEVLGRARSNGSDTVSQNDSKTTSPDNLLKVAKEIQMSSPVACEKGEPDVTSVTVVNTTFASSETTEPSTGSSIAGSSVGGVIFYMNENVSIAESEKSYGNISSDDSFSKVSMSDHKQTGMEFEVLLQPSGCMLQVSDSGNTLERSSSKTSLDGFYENSGSSAGSWANRSRSCGVHHTSEHKPLVDEKVLTSCSTAEFVIELLTTSGCNYTKDNAVETVKSTQRDTLQGCLGVETGACVTEEESVFAAAFTYAKESLTVTRDFGEQTGKEGKESMCGVVDCGGNEHLATSESDKNFQDKTAVMATVMNVCSTQIDSTLNNTATKEVLSYFRCLQGQSRGSESPAQVEMAADPSSVSLSNGIIGLSSTVKRDEDSCPSSYLAAYKQDCSPLNQSSGSAMQSSRSNEKVYPVVTPASVDTDAFGFPLNLPDVEGRLFITASTTTDTATPVQIFASLNNAEKSSDSALESMERFSGEEASRITTYQLLESSCGTLTCEPEPEIVADALFRSSQEALLPFLRPKLSPDADADTKDIQVANAFGQQERSCDIQDLPHASLINYNLVDCYVPLDDDEEEETHRTGRASRGRSRSRRSKSRNSDKKQSILSRWRENSNEPSAMV